MKRNRSDAKESQSAGIRPLRGAALKQESVTQALTHALFEEWAQQGYGALSLEAVAKRAGVGKAALYRRWPSKLAMVSDLLAKTGVDLAEYPDTGSLEGDIRAMLRTIQRLLRHRLIRRILPDLHAEMMRSPELALAVRARATLGRRIKGAQALRKAIERGELPVDTDIELAMDAIGSLLYWRFIVTGAKIDKPYLENLTHFLLAGLRQIK